MRNFTRYILQVLSIAYCSLASFGTVAQVIPPQNDTRDVGVSAFFQNKVAGIITDAATGKPLEGVRVTYKNLTAAITDEKGKFVLAVPSYKVSIQVEGEGFQTKEVALKGQTNIATVLYDENHSSPYKTVNLPTHTVSQNATPYSVGSVQVQGWDKVLETPDTYLQGRVSGLNVTRRSGTPNSGSSFFLRGLSSLNASNQPLIVVDGLIYDNSHYGNSLIFNYYDNPLANIDIRDVDNITVLKDGASTIYGTKGANGVILITTTRAKELATKIDFGTYGGINFTPKNLPMMNAYDYRTYLSDVLRSSGKSADEIAGYPFMNDEPKFAEYYRYHYDTNWQKKVMDNHYLQNVYLKVTGGDNVAKYALSLNYLKNQGALNATKLGRYNTRFNADLNLSKRLTSSINLSFSLNEQELKNQGIQPTTNPVYLGLVKAPFLHSYDVSSDGIESPDLADRDIFNVSNPAAVIGLMQARNQNYRFLGGVSFLYKLSNSFDLGSTIGINFDKIKENSFVPRKGVVSDTLSNTIAYSKLASQTKRIYYIFNENYVSFRRTFAHVHAFNARLGMRYISSKIEQDFGLGYNSATDELVSVGNGVGALRRVGGNIGESRWLNSYLSADYGFSDKYFLAFNVALDGSSRFGTDVLKEAVKIGNRSFAVLPSLSAAWLISSENFMANSGINFLKIRASVGLSGNDGIGDYNARQYYVSQNLLGMQGLVRGNFANPNLKWESVLKTNVGFDLSILNERLTFTIDAFQHDIRDMLLKEPAPVASGLPYLHTNSGTMQTRGLEASINMRILNTATLKWDLGANITTVRTIVKSLPVEQILTPFGKGTIVTKVGEAPNTFYGYVTKGVYTSDAEATQEGLKTKLFDGTLADFKGGDVRFVDLDNNKTIDEKDRQLIGNPTPKFYGGITNRVTWNNWTLDALCTFVAGNSIYNYTRSQIESLSGFNNQSQAMNNRWRADGHVTDVPKATWGDPLQNGRFSDRWIEDGSYLRLRTVSLSYSWPVNKKVLKYVTAYLTGNNLLTFTNYLGYDPEFSATNSVLGQGTDLLLEPIQKSCQLGIRIGL